MLVLYCQTCSRGCSTYRKWITHLFSPAHQKKAKPIIKGWSKEKKGRAVIFTEFCKPYEEVEEDEFKKLAWKVSEHTIISDLFFSCSQQMCLILIDEKKGAEFVVNTDDIVASDGHYLHVGLAGDIPSTEWEDLFQRRKKQLEANPGKNNNTDIPEVEQEIKVEVNKDSENAEIVILDGNHKDVTRNNHVATAVNTSEVENNKVLEFEHSTNKQNVKTKNFKKPIKIKEDNSKSVSTELSATVKENTLSEAERPLLKGTTGKIILEGLSIRIGSYKVAKPKVRRFEAHFSLNFGVLFWIPRRSKPRSKVQICVPVKSVLSMQVCVEGLYCLFMTVDDKYTVWIRKQLGMVNKVDSQYYFCPKNGRIHQKSIVMLSDLHSKSKLEELSKIFGRVFKFIDYKTAQNMLLQLHPNDKKSPAPPIVPQNDIKNLGVTLQSDRDVQTTSKVKCSNPAVLTESFSTPSETNASSTELKTLLASNWNIDLNNRDVESLHEGNSVNSNIVEFWLNYMKQNSLSSEDKERTYIFSPRFYSKLNKNIRTVSTKLPVSLKRHARVAKWTTNEDIFKYDFLLVPILDDNSRWILAVICFPSLNGVYNLYTGEIITELKAKMEKHEERNSSLSINNKNGPNNGKHDVSVCGAPSDACSQNHFVPTICRLIKRPCILIFDSCDVKARITIYSILREYLRAEYMVKKGIDKEINCDTMPGCLPKTPCGSNDCDSGIYLLQCAESFFSDPIKSFKLPLTSELRTWFTSAMVQEKRKYIFECIVQLVKTENPESSAYIPQLIFGSGNSSTTAETSQNLPSGNETEDKYLSSGSPASKKPKLG